MQMKYDAPPDKHLSNKDEGRVLRRLMSQNKMSEDEVRSHKKFRVMLAEARAAGHKKKSYSYYTLVPSEKRMIRKMRAANSKDMSKHPFHPDVLLKTLNQIRDNVNRGAFGGWRDRTLLRLSTQDIKEV